MWRCYVRKFIAQGIYFEPEEEEVNDPVMGVRSGHDVLGFSDSYYRRRSSIEDIKDDFEERMRNFRQLRQEKNRVVDTPDGFAVSIAYNKSGYQLIPKKDLTNT